MNRKDFAASVDKLSLLREILSSAHTKVSLVQVEFRLLCKTSQTDCSCNVTPLKLLSDHGFTGYYVKAINAVKRSLIKLHVQDELYAELHNFSRGFINLYDEE